MKNGKTLFIAALFCLAALGVSGVAVGADDLQQAYTEYSNAVMPLRQQLREKRFALRDMYAGGQRDDAKAQRLFQEIAEIEGKLFAAESDFQTKTEAAGGLQGMAGMHHEGEFMPMNGCGMGYGMGMRGGMTGMGHRGGGYGHGRHGW